MKINGKSLSEPYIETVVFNRQSGPVAIKARAVLSYADFEKLVPEPTPPVRVYPDGRKSQNVEDPEFKKAVKRRGLLRHYWMMIQSLLATPGIEFDTVNLGDPDTWENLETELATSGFTPFDVSRIFNAVMAANGLNDAKLKQAEKDFLESQAAAQAQPLLPFPTTDQPSTPSGEPANAPK